MISRVGLSGEDERNGVGMCEGTVRHVGNCASDDMSVLI
jgi:hypothetical protein